ncbi:MAG: hypothetical protein IPG75_15235 [Gemmatimonadetes bacterium]|nr:hypothetical protein [Gemmatimonadota bacterium]
MLAPSLEARRAGITRGMPVAEARKRCPDLIIRPPNPQLYARASRAPSTILRRYAPVIEPKGYGHAYLDLTGTGRLFGPAVDVALRIQREAAQRLRLPLAVGGAQNKLVSAAAAEVVKGDGAAARRPGGSAEWLLDVAVGHEATFLAPERVELLPDLDPRMRRRLDDYQLDLIGEVQAITARELAMVFGTAGRLLHQHACGIDPRPVLPPAVKAEFRAAHTLADDSNDRTLLLTVLRHLTERLGGRLRARHSWPAASPCTWPHRLRHRPAQRPCPLAALDLELWDAARRAFHLARERTVALRAVGVTVDRFLEADLQMELGFEPREAESGKRETDEPPSRPQLELREAGNGRAAELQAAMDRIRGRWGTKGVRVGR